MTTIEGNEWLKSFNSMSFFIDDDPNEALLAMCYKVFSTHKQKWIERIEMLLCCYQKALQLVGQFQRYVLI